MAIVALPAMTLILLRERRVALAASAAIAFIAAVHLPSGGLAYYEAGVGSFFFFTGSQSGGKYTVKDVMDGRSDQSGAARA